MKGSRVAIAAILILAAGLRLTWALWPIWGDEIMSVTATSIPLKSLIDYYTFDPHPPLFYSTLRLIHFIGIPDQLLKLIPLIYSLFTIWLAYLILLKLNKPNVAIVCALMLALNPLDIYLGGELRDIGASAFWATLGLYLLIKWLDSDRTKSPKALWLTVAVASLHHYYGLFFFSALALFPFISGLKKEETLRYFKGAIWAAVPWAIWSPFFISQFLHGQSYRELAPFKFLVFFSSTALTINGCPWRVQNLFDLLKINSTGFSLLFLIALIFFAALAVGFWRKNFWKSPARIWFILPFFFAFVTANIIPIFTIKYNGVFIPAFYIGVALGLSELSKLNKFVATFTSFILSCLLFAFALDLNFNPKNLPPNWPKVIEMMETESKPTDVLVSYAEWASSDFLYHFKKSPLNKMESIDILGPNQPGKIPKVTDELLGNLAKKIAGKNRVWFITHHIIFTDPQGKAEKFLTSLYPYHKKWVINEDMKLYLYLNWK